MICSLVDLFVYGAACVSNFRTELTVFCIAVILHTLLFGKLAVPASKQKAKHVDSASALRTSKAGLQTPPKRPSERSEPDSNLKPRDSRSSVRSDGSDAQPMLQSRAPLELFKERRPSRDEGGAFPASEQAESLMAALKSLDRGAAHSARAERVFEDVDQYDAPEELLLITVVDTCLRLERGDFLRHWLQGHRKNFNRVKRVHTYTSLIRAYGVLKQIDLAWDTWQEMLKVYSSPNCVPLGCMVEALVANDDPEAAYQLIRDVRMKERGSHSVVNGVVYGTVLKGFAHHKKFQRVWAVYQEMLEVNTDFSLVTFNTIIDACARCGALDKIPELLTDMERFEVHPNIITYGAILKGYCQEGKLDQAYSLLEGMKESTEYRPDEIMYNTLLDGCARDGLWDRAQLILKEMEEASLVPSNFSLSVLVKVGRRSAVRPDAVFAVCEEVSTRHKFKYNVHVYTNLIHLLVDRRDFRKAVSLFEEMVWARVRPEARTYGLLLKGLVQGKEHEAAEDVLRAAVGLPMAHGRLSGDLRCAQLRDAVSTLPRQVIGDVVSARVAHCRNAEDEFKAGQLLQDLKERGFRVDTRIQMRLAARAAQQPPAGQPWSRYRA